MKLKTGLLLPPLLILLFACGRNAAVQSSTLDANNLRTEAVSTFAAGLTETQAAPPSATSYITAFPTFTPTTIPITVLPTPTANPCYRLKWIKDVTIPDGTHLKAGESFTKTWQVQNIGVCAWRAGFTFNNVGGDRMQGSAITLQEPVPSGSKPELSVQLVVPSGRSGLVQSSWRMADLDGNYFGDTLSVNILVGDITTPAPSP